MHWGSSEFSTLIDLKMMSKTEDVGAWRQCPNYLSLLQVTLRILKVLKLITFLPHHKHHEKGRAEYSPHFMDEKIEAQRGKARCSRS
jgi:hypothetical protein